MSPLAISTYLACLQFAVGLKIDFVMVLDVPEIPPKVTGIVTIRLGRAGVKGKSDDVILYDVFFLTASLIDYGCIKWQTNIISYMDVIWYDQIRCQFSMTSQLILSYF